MSVVRQKVYESDFVSSDAMLELAYVLLAEYKGNWEVLIESKRYVLAGGTLTKLEARRSLNRLLSQGDPEINAKIQEAICEHEHPDDLRPPRLAAVKEIPRKHTVETSATLHSRLFRSSVWNGKIHFVRRAKILWLPRYDDFYNPRNPDYEHRIPTLRVEAVCLKTFEHKSAGSYGGTKLEFGYDRSAFALEHEMCPKCLTYVPSIGR